MAEKSLQARIQNKCDTTANWEKATNFVPKKGEIIVYSDGGGTGIPKMKVGDGATKVGSLKFADEGQYLPLAGGKLTGPLSRGAITMNSQSGGGSGYGYNSLIFYQTSEGATVSNAKVAFQYRIPTGTSSGTMRVVAPEFEGKLIGNADTATTASSVSNSLSINGKSYNGSAAVDAGTVGIAYGGTGKTTRKEALTALLGQQHSNNLNEAFEQSIYVWDNSTTNIPTNYGTLISLLNYGDTHDNAHNWLTHIAIGTNDTLYWRQKINNKDFTNWKTILDSNNYSTYVATKDHNHDGTYLKTLPIASSSTLGCVKIGSGLTVAADGTISAAAAYTLPTASSSVKGGIKVGTGLTMSSETLNHSNSVTAKTAYGSTATTASANGGSITVTDIKYDAQGHITGSTDRTITLSQTTYTLAGLMGSAAKGSETQPVYWNGSAWTNTTYTLGKSVPADAKFTDTVYTLPTASSTLGGVKTTSTVSATTGLTACPIIDGVVYYKDTNNTYTLAGLVGSTAIGTATNPIYWDGTKFVKTTYTLSKSVPADAKFTDTVYTLPIASSSTLGGIKLGTGLTAAADGTVNVSGSTQSETISIATTDWSGSGPYTATKTLTNTYDSTTHDVSISLPQMSSSDVTKYDAIASAKMVISACNGTSVTIVALGDKPTVPVSIAIMQV